MVAVIIFPEGSTPSIYMRRPSSSLLLVMSDSAPEGSGSAARPPAQTSSEPSTAPRRRFDRGRRPSSRSFGRTRTRPRTGFQRETRALREVVWVVEDPQPTRRAQLIGGSPHPIPPGTTSPVVTTALHSGNGCWPCDTGSDANYPRSAHRAGVRRRCRPRVTGRWTTRIGSPRSVAIPPPLLPRGTRADTPRRDPPALDGHRGLSRRRTLGGG